jgi:hypothetical protein
MAPADEIGAVRSDRTTSGLGEKGAATTKTHVRSLPAGQARKGV